MIIRLFTIFIFFMVISCGNSQKIDTKYTNEKGRFKVAFLEIPKETEELLDVDGGKIKRYLFSIYPKNNNNLAYQLSYLDLPKKITDTLKNADIYLLLDDLRLSVLDNFQYRNLHIFNIELLGYLGREYHMQRDDTQDFFKVRAYLVGNRVYILSVTTSKEKPSNIGINQFLESFELIATQPNPKINTSPKINYSKSFNISFPKNPEIQEREAPSEYGISKYIIYIFQPKLLNDKNLSYSVLEIKHPIDVTKTKDFHLQKLYNQAIDFSLNSRQSTLISKKIIQIENKEAIEFKESFKNGQLVIKQRLLIVGDTQYLIQVMTIAENDENPEMNKFIESFSLIAK